MTVFEVSEAWRSAFAGAHAGVLIMHGVTNPAGHAALQSEKRRLEDELRARFAGLDRRAIEELAPIQAYTAHYKRFKKTYHLQLQLESIVFKDKSIPNVAALVEAMFMAEIKNLLLTAGHDLDALEPPVVLDVATGRESYTLLRGDDQALKAGDMYIRDRRGVMSSVVYGPDRRTQIGSGTQRVIFTVYAPAGIDPAAVYRHLEDIRDNVWLVSPSAQVALAEVYGATRAVPPDETRA
jgi:DNA/RNA-binding domain of Phe-tRNA-synthetase-like protein